MVTFLESSSPLNSHLSDTASAEYMFRHLSQATDYSAPDLSLAHSLMCLVPVSADSHIHLERHRQIRCADHVCPNLSYERIDRGIGDLEYQLIMHLHDEARRNPGTLQPGVHLDHGALDDVGGSALHGRIDGAAFGVLA